MTTADVKQRAAVFFNHHGRIFKLARKPPHDENDIYIQVRRSLLITRCLLFALTSLFYLAGPPHSNLHIKLLVVATMLAATMLAQNLYSSWQPRIQPAPDNTDGASVNQRHKYPLLRLIMVETIGVALLTIPTGGLDSPFAWYALNPIMTAALLLPGFNCWGVLFVFIVSASAAGIIYPGLDLSYWSFLYSHLGKLLVLLLTTAMTQVSAGLYRRLVLAYENLAKAHATSERSLEHIASLYQALEAFSRQEDREKLAEVLAAYAAKLCDRPAACLIRGDFNDNEGPVTVLRFSHSDLQDEIDWPGVMNCLWSEVKPGRDFLHRYLPDGGRCLTAAPITSNAEHFGILAYIEEPAAESWLEERKKSLQFLASLGGIIAERMKCNNLWGRLLVSEEQNRISNEIHDGVAQYLFSVVCALHSLSKENGHLQDENIQQNFRLIEETARRASSELRASIYHLNPAKRGESLFIDTLASYLDDLARLNCIRVDLQAEGNEEVLSPALRKGLYRIVREACSNAIRHGKCSGITVRITMATARTILEIEDNGRAFPAPENGRKEPWKEGMGLRNMRQIAADFNGELKIESRPGKGTLLKCAIPKYINFIDDLKEAVGG